MDEQPHDVDALGGRLALVPLDRMDVLQRNLVDRLQASRGETARASGYLAALPDGRLVGPFNPLLRVPDLAGPHLAWSTAIAAAPLPSDVREVAVLAIAHEWQADYERYAHERVASSIGIPAEAVQAIADGREPRGLSSEASASHRFTTALVREHDVPDSVYTAALEALGERTLVVLVELIGQYLTTSALLTAFRVPAPA